MFAKVLKDSVGPTGQRLTTFIVKFHRFILPELNTHRALSKNVASSRAIPVHKLIAMAEEDPASPLFWGKNQAGMSAKEELSDIYKGHAQLLWDKARKNAIDSAKALIDADLHKQIANRLLEPFIYTTAIVTATDFANFYALRTNKETAQPEMCALAELMLQAHRASEPKPLAFGEWHLPFVTEVEALDLNTAKKCSVARCARVSYLLHNGNAPDIKKDIELHDKLLKFQHMSPFEHQATPITGIYGNLKNWKPYRKFIPNENITDFKI